MEHWRQVVYHGQPLICRCVCIYIQVPHSVTAFKSKLRNVKRNDVLRMWVPPGEDWQGKQISVDEANGEVC